MGWWGTDVMAGDQPLDQLAMISDYCVVEFDSQNDSGLGGYLSSYAFTAENVNDFRAATLSAIGKIRDDETRFISYQVFGVVIMAVGAEMPWDVKNQIAAAASMDAWAAEGDEERIAHMRSYLKMVEAYDGTPTPYEGKVLFG